MGRLYQYLFIFGNWVLLVRVAMDPEPIMRTGCEFRISRHHHSFTPRGNL